MLKRIFAVVTIILVICGCKKDPGPNEVFIISSGTDGFNPTTLTVSVGTTVTWTNKERTIHTVTSDSLYFDSGDLKKRGKFSYTFSSSGVYGYHCKHHQVMKGTVVVQ